MTGIRDNAVDLPRSIHRLSEPLSDRSFGRHIDDRRHHVRRSGNAQLMLGGTVFRGVAAPDHETGALTRQAHGKAQSDPAVPAGYQGGSAVKVKQVRCDDLPPIAVRALCLSDQFR